MLIIPRDSRTPLLDAAAVSVSGREENHQNAQMWKAKTAEEPPFLSVANQNSDAAAVLVSALLGEPVNSV